MRLLRRIAILIEAVLITVFLVFFILTMSIIFDRMANGDDRARVVVIDTGLDQWNPKLNSVLCPAGEHFNAVTNKREIPQDRHGHGTHIAGIIRALAGDKGYCLSICKYYEDSAPGKINLRNTVRCLKFAAEVGASFVNYSGGGPEFSEDEYLAYRALHGALVFVAAGNEHQNIDLDSNAYYPASYRLPDMTAVSAVDYRGDRLRSSNWGPKTVKIALPGDSLYSTMIGRMGFMTGTSQATAVATGLALRARLGLGGIGPVREYPMYFLNFWKRP